MAKSEDFEVLKGKIITKIDVHYGDSGDQIVFTCEDGTRGFLGVVSQPGIMSFLELGYIYDRKGNKHAIQVKF